MIELSIPLRKELKAQEGENKLLDKPQAHLIFNLVDYPRTQEELDDFIKFRNPLNKVIAINEEKPKDFEKLLAEQNRPKPAPVEGQPLPPADADQKPAIQLIQNEDRDLTMTFLRCFDYK